MTAVLGVSAGEFRGNDLQGPCCINSASKFFSGRICKATVADDQVSQGIDASAALRGNSREELAIVDIYIAEDISIDMASVNPATFFKYTIPKSRGAGTDSTNAVFGRVGCIPKAHCIEIRASAVLLYNDPGGCIP